MVVLHGALTGYPLGAIADAATAEERRCDRIAVDGGQAVIAFDARTMPKDYLRTAAEQARSKEAPLCETRIPMEPLCQPADASACSSSLGTRRLLPALPPAAAAAS